ncbi:hypothetical protein [Peredibacter starrii]|uniref:Uncharacterized protein n=1 Tax=Peredibacter starrii TaxID=28202 RepID=A0AAX4HU36_9BACT|nr:hypothetical protein [Peredibacter starrii]WPU66444.1 hypothetical protein SOO65_06765 [Peredibacter starrii]
MQVLIENPDAKLKAKPKTLLPSFWSPSMFYMGPTFSMTSLFDLSDPLGLSPFVSVDAKIAFLIGQIDSEGAVYAKNMGALGVVGLQFISRSVTHAEDPKKILDYYREYFSSGTEINPDVNSFDHVVVFGEARVVPELWQKLKSGGTYIFGATEPLIFPDPALFEAKGNLWPVGESTEFGWKFNNDELGLSQFEFGRIQKL